MAHAIIQQIVQFRGCRGTLFAERRSRGYPLSDAESGTLVALVRTQKCGKSS